MRTTILLNYGYSFLEGKDGIKLSLWIVTGSTLSNKLAQSQRYFIRFDESISKDPINHPAHERITGQAQAILYRDARMNLETKAYVIALIGLSILPVFDESMMDG